MSIMARAMAKDPNAGYAIDFVTVTMAENARELAERGIKVIANAGGLNPKACAEALERLLAKQGIALKVGYVTGDDSDAGRRSLARAWPQGDCSPASRCRRSRSA
jgi:hypothetical protein